MEVSELQGDLLECYRARSSFWVPKIPPLWEGEPGSTAQWEFGPIFSERITEAMDREFNAYISEASAVCVATQVSGPNPGVQGIARIRLQVPNDEDETPATRPMRSSSRTQNELRILKRLTELESKYTPKLLASIETTQTDDYPGPGHYPVPGGFLAIMIMEKLPGHNLSNFAELPMSERNQVRLAFAKAIREFYSLGYNHLDEANRNLMWDPKHKKCYIIDLEDAYEVEKGGTRKFKPEVDFSQWEIAGPHAAHMHGYDPMVPCSFEFVADPGDEELEKWAAESVGKDLVIPVYDLKALKRIR